MKKVRFVLIFFVLLLTGVFFFFPRTPIVNMLKIETGVPALPDLIAVLGGGITRGGFLGNSTRERLDAVVAYVRTKAVKSPILVQEYPAGRKKMVDYLSENGISRNQILVSGFHYSEKRGGTENNIGELFYLLKTHREMKRVLLVTSPYHQRRVMLILKSAEKGLNRRNIRFYFLQLPDNGEINRCPRIRFWRLIIHEAIGIFFQRLRV
ncbi:MAG: YdcF family protein [Acidobacteria bacterium]|nr:YdcF family protein [Acidobacteriota bacterium]